MLITRLLLIMTTPTQMSPAEMGLLDLMGPCIACHEFEVHNGMAYCTRDLRCVTCRRAQRYCTVWPLPVVIAAGWRMMFKLAKKAHDAQAKAQARQDETLGIPADLDPLSKRILREMRQ